MIYAALWVVWLLLLWYVSASVSDQKPFDPFEILEIDRSATDRDIKKAYRQMSLRFHPDKVGAGPIAATFLDVHGVHDTGIKLAVSP